MICPITEGARESPESEALRFEGTVWTYAELDEAVSNWSTHLTHLGVEPGSRVALIANNEPHAVLTFWAAARLGATLVPLNARLTVPERAKLLERVNPSVILSSPFLPSAVQRGSTTGRPWGISILLFTSGTTGEPKGVHLTEGHFKASAQASSENLAGRGWLRTAVPVPLHSPPEPRARWLGTLPLFHVGGLAMLTRTAFERGCLVLHRRFDASAVLDSIRNEGVTHASFVATTLERLVDALEGDRFPESLRIALIGGGPVPSALLERTKAAGLLALQTYGLTEACSQVTTESPGEADGQTAGRPLNGTDVRIVDADGTPVAAGIEGEIEVKGSTVTAGYWNDPDATREAFREGWFRTKDVGVLDVRGRLRVLSRRTDLIVRGGENVYPAEIEAVLAEHSEIREAAVIGVPDDRWGQVAHAYVVARTNPVDPEELEAWCRARLARFKIPTAFHWLNELPRNAMGKVQRTALPLTAGE